MEEEEMAEIEDKEEEEVVIMQTLWLRLKELEVL